MDGNTDPVPNRSGETYAQRTAGGLTTADEKVASDPINNDNSGEPVVPPFRLHHARPSLERTKIIPQGSSLVVSLLLEFLLRLLSVPSIEHLARPWLPFQ